jgi:hypothetical protein
LGKYEEYEEPQRKGTARGEPIGFSLDKFASALYSLTNHKQKELAKSLGVSYGLLRKWHTEDAFIKIMMELHREFADIFFDYILNVRPQRKTEEHLALMKRPLKDLMDVEVVRAASFLPYTEIDDLTGYSALLEFLIFDRLNDEGFIKSLTPEQSVEILTLIDYMEWIYEKARKKSDKDAVKKPARKGRAKAGASPEDVKRRKGEIARIARSSFIGNAKELLLKPDMNEEDRKHIMYVLTSLEEIA